MGGRFWILVCLAVGGLALQGAGPAVAQGGGTTTSAGDQQYVDPLSTNTSTTPKPSTTTTPAPSSSSTPPSAPPQATTSSSPATPQTTAGSAHTLPFTGLNLGLLVAVGLGLIGGGLLLRRVARHR